jgi:hypothetical protein
MAAGNIIFFEYTMPINIKITINENGSRVLTNMAATMI